MNNKKHFSVFMLALALCSVMACTHAKRYANEDGNGSRANRKPSQSSEARNIGTLENPVLGEEYFHTNGEYGIHPASATQDEENAEFAKLTEEISEIQTKIEGLHHQPPQRGFHGKHHGCLQARFDIFDPQTIANKVKGMYPQEVAAGNLDPDKTAQRTQYGLFQGPASYWILARFSNGVGFAQPDRLPDVRGLAFKVLGRTDGTRLSSEEPEVTTQDFLMTNQPVPMGANATEFMEFAKFNAQMIISVILQKKEFTDLHPRVGKALNVVAFGGINPGKAVRSMVKLNYWGGSPYRLGPDSEKIAIKFLVRPEGNLPKGTAGPPIASLAKDLETRVRNGEIKYGFYVQFQKDPIKTPVEDTLVQWDEDFAKPILIGTITFLKQDISPSGSNYAAKNNFCRDMTLNPWHSLEAHHPMGNLNRARRVVYATSARHRLGLTSNPADTSLEEVERVFGPFKSGN